MDLNINADKINGLEQDAADKLKNLIKIYEYARPKNAQKEKYYEGKIPLGEVNLGIALPQGMRGLEIGCAWGAKTVDVLAGRSMFDGYVGESGEEVAELNEIVKNNNLIAEYPKA